MEEDEKVDSDSLVGNENSQIEELEMIEHSDEILSRLHRSVDDNLY